MQHYEDVNDEVIRAVKYSIGNEQNERTMRVTVSVLTLHGEFFQIQYKANEVSLVLDLKE